MFRLAYAASLPTLALALVAAGCATAPKATPAAGDALSVQGTIVSIDTQPWAYDGNAVIAIDSMERGRIAVQLPARWNLCQAAPVDVETLAVGIRVHVTGEATQDGELVVCGDATHRLVPVK